MVLDTVTRIIAEVCCIEQSSIVPERELLEYGMDSARAMDLVVALEDFFDVEIPDEIIIGLRTGNDVILALEGLSK